MLPIRQNKFDDLGWHHLWSHRTSYICISLSFFIIISFVLEMWFKQIILFWVVATYCSEISNWCNGHCFIWKIYFLFISISVLINLRDLFIVLFSWICSNPLSTQLLPNIFRVISINRNSSSVKLCRAVLLWQARHAIKKQTSGLTEKALSVYQTNCEMAVVKATL